jgi:putative two-component system response regulator
MIILDIMMPGIDGYEVIRRLKANERLSSIPVIFLTSKNDEQSEIECLQLGAADYVHRPFSAPRLLRRIENHLLLISQRKELKKLNDNLQDMVCQKTNQVVNLQNAVLSTVAEMVEFRDNMTGRHVTRTQKYLQLMVDKLIEKKIYEDEIATWDLEFLIPAAQLHDVGKIAISDAILNKPGKLTPEEFEEMKRHVEVGVRAIERIAGKTEEHAFLRHARPIASAHHEKWDGSGYPAGLRGDEIPLEGRLMAIADVYDALVSTRPYKEPLPTKVAEKIIKEGSGTHFEPALVNVFVMVADHLAEIAESYR